MKHLQSLVQGSFFRKIANHVCRLLIFGKIAYGRDIVKARNGREWLACTNGLDKVNMQPTLNLILR